MPMYVAKYSKLLPGDSIFNLVLPSADYEYNVNQPGIYSVEIPEKGDKVLEKFVERIKPKEPNEEALRETVRRISQEFLLTEEADRKGSISVVELLSEQVKRASCFETAIVLQLVLQGSGVESYFTVGTRGMTQPRYHAWVEVIINGKHYIADAANIDRSKIVFEEKEHAPFNYTPLFHVLFRNAEENHIRQVVLV